MKPTPHLQSFNQQIDGTEKTFASMAQQHEHTKRLLKVRGIGPQTATSIIAAIGDGSQFDKSRDLAAWLSLVPKQFSTGGNCLGRITKHGDKYRGQTRPA